MIDWLHVGELIISGSFTAGVAWATMRGELKLLHSGVRAARKEAERANSRIDTFLSRGVTK